MNLRIPQLQAIAAWAGISLSDRLLLHGIVSGNEEYFHYLYFVIKCQMEIVLTLFQNE
jgi:hypothetical protein